MPGAAYNPGIKGSTKRFTEAARDYHLHRPAYPERLVSWVLKTCRLGPGARAADVGCGTGIATRQLARRGLAVVGVEPNEAMLSFARRSGGALYRRGLSTRTGLPDASVDLVLCAQAFHWLDVPKTLREFRRILRPGGWCALLWNLETGKTPFMEGYRRLYREYSVEYPKRPDAKSAIAELKAQPGLRGLREAEFRHRHPLDLSGLLGLTRSISDVRAAAMRLGSLERDLRALFTRCARRGRVQALYRSIGLCWRFAPGPTARRGA